MSINNTKYIVKVNKDNLANRWILNDTYFEFATLEDAISFLRAHYLEDVFIMFDTIRDTDNRIDQGSLISTSWYDVIKYNSINFNKE